MTLSELKIKIDNLHKSCRNPDEINVGIPVFREFAIGSRPTVSVDDIYLGFDWDEGYVICLSNG